MGASCSKAPTPTVIVEEPIEVPEYPNKPYPTGDEAAAAEAAASHTPSLTSFAVELDKNGSLGFGVGSTEMHTVRYGWARFGELLEVTSIMDGSTAALSGLIATGDLLASVNGQRMMSGGDTLSILKRLPDGPVRLQFSRPPARHAPSPHGINPDHLPSQQAATIIQGAQRGASARRMIATLRKEELELRQQTVSANAAATSIQAKYRGMIARRDASAIRQAPTAPVSSWKLKEEAATTLQAAHRGRRARQQMLASGAAAAGAAACESSEVDAYLDGSCVPRRPARLPGSPDESLIEGWLIKRGSGFPYSWKRRYMVMVPFGGLVRLTYYEAPETPAAAAPASAALAEESPSGRPKATSYFELLAQQPGRAVLKGDYAVRSVRPLPSDGEASLRFEIGPIASRPSASSSARTRQSSEEPLFSRLSAVFSANDRLSSPPSNEREMVARAPSVDERDAWLLSFQAYMRSLPPDLLPPGADSSRTAFTEHSGFV